MQAVSDLARPRGQEHQMASHALTSSRLAGAESARAGVRRFGLRRGDLSITHPVALTAVIIIASAALAMMIVDDRLRLLLVPPMAIAGLWGVGRFPFAATCAVVALGATLFHPAQFKVGVGPLDLRLSEVILGALLLIALVRPRRAWWGGTPGIALLTFFAVLTVSAIAAMTSGRAHPSDAYHYSRALAPLLLFFVVIRLFPAPHDARRLLLAAGLLSIVTGVASVLAAPPGSPIADILAPKDLPVNERPPPGQTDGLGLVNRLRLPGAALAYVLFWYAASHVLRVRGASRILWTAIAVAIAATIAVSLNRNMWLGLALGGLIFFTLSRGSSRRGLVAAALVAAALIAGVALAGIQVDRDSPAYVFVARAQTLLDPEAQTRTSSLTDRFYENRYAIATIREHPLMGVGPGAPFGLRDVENLGGGSFRRIDALFAHNQYLHLLLIGGPLLVVSLLVFLITPAARVLRKNYDDGVIALSTAVAMILVSAVVFQTFVDAPFALVVGLLVGCLTVLTDRSVLDRRAGGRSG